MFTFLFVLFQAAYSQILIGQVKAANGKWGYINIYGEEITPAIYQKCYPFSCNVATIQDTSGQYYLINSKGEKIVPEISGFTIKEDPEMLLGTILFSDGLIPVKNSLWGFMNTSGKLIIPQKYDDVTMFNDRHAIAKSSNIYFVLDTHGKEIPVYIPGLMNIKPFSEGLAVFELASGKFGYIDTTGKVVIQPNYFGAGNFSAGMAWAKAVDGKVGFINHFAAWAIRPSFDAAHDFDAVSGLARVKTTGFTVYSQRDGKVMFFTTTKHFGDFKEGFSIGEKNGKFGYFNAAAEWAIVPEFDGAKDFKNGFAPVKQGDKWGLIDKYGKWIIDPNYLAMKNFELVQE